MFFFVQYDRASQDEHFFTVKGEAILANLDAPFSFVVFLGMLHYSLWEMPVRGQTVTRNLNREVYASSQIEYYVDIPHKRYSAGFYQ